MTLGRLAGLAGWLAVGGGCLAAAAYLGLLPGGGHAPPPAPPAAARPPEPIAVTVTPATPRAIERRVRTVGTLFGFEEIEISPQVDGNVRRVLHDVGDVVAPGTALLEIDDADFQLAVREHARALELELSRLGLTAAPGPAFDLTRLPSVARARLVEQNAATTLERFKGLADRSVITKDDYDKAVLNLETARLDTQQRLLEAEQTLAAVRHRQAVLETAEKRLRDTKITAPAITARTPPGVVPGGEQAPQPTAAPELSYTIAERFVSEGEIVRAAPPTTLFRLVVDSVLKLKAAIPERYASQVRPGQPVDLAVESLPGRRIVGRVSRVNPTVDTASRTFEVEVWVPNEERLLKPGSFATASILVGADADAVTVPEEAVVRYAGVTKVFTVVDGTAAVMPVELGQRLDVAADSGATRRWVEVSGGIAAGAAVVTTGHSQLSQGAPVRVRDARQGSTEAEVREARRSEPPAGEGPR